MTANKKLTLNQSWSMAVGGMIGGGIFSTLGVVIAIAGNWAWLSFATAGLIALTAGYSYSKLTIHYDKGGGAFTFLREAGASKFAGDLAWMLIIGYVLTNAVYAFTFGEYLAHVLGLGPIFARSSAVGVMFVFIWLNLRSISEAGFVEALLVWLKLLILVGLAAWGLHLWDPQMLSRGVPESSFTAALFGAASVFMAYEGFQLLAYDYEDIGEPKKNLSRAIMWAILVVIMVYVMVTLGTAMLIGADEIVKNKEVALAIAGQEAFGTAGLVVVTIGAAFSTGSAINSTLFATARLSHTVASAGDLPKSIKHQNRFGIPDRAVIVLGVLAAVLAAIGSLTTLVEAASLAFLFTFAVVCALAFAAKAGRRWITVAGVVLSSAAVGALVIRLYESDPLPLFALAIVIPGSMLARRFFMR